MLYLFRLLIYPYFPPVNVKAWEWFHCFNSQLQVRIDLPPSNPARLSILTTACVKLYVVLFSEAMSEALHKGCEHVSFNTSIIYVFLYISMHNLWCSCYCTRSLKDNAKITSARVRYRESGVVRNFPTWQGHFFTSWIIVTVWILQKACSSLGSACLQKQKPPCESGWLAVWTFFYFFTHSLCLRGCAVIIYMFHIYSLLIETPRLY